ncbi:MAG: alkaline phosphatase [Phycisphaerales bacterium]|nr:alkaline phosphatase [Phycisphaerales bacterium]MCB9835578.1 alkaline phosphatase [Phycisphaera sp.]
MNPDRSTRTLLSRRHLLGIGAGGAIATAMPASFARARVPAPRWSKPSRPVRNIVFMVGDGMGQGVITLADMMLKLQSRGPSNYQKIIENHAAFRRATCMTHSADGWVTDSAAAGSAWGIGEHINNGAVNFTPDERTPEPILVTAKNAGKRTGLVTTTRITHATPASFIANVPHRDLEDDIAKQILDRRVDVALGGGLKHFPNSVLAEHKDITLVTNRAELARTPSEGRLLGLFAHDHCPFSLDRPETCPSLSEMSLAALNRLDRAPEGFVLQIEGGRIDHAAHDNDAGSLVFDQIAFDETIGTVLQWAEGRDDTLIIVTADHVTANPGLTFYAKDGKRSFKRLQSTSHSFDWIADRYGEGDKTLDRFVSIVQDAVRFELTSEDVVSIERALIQKQQVDPFNVANGVWMVLGSVLANHTGVAFLSPNHTADYVEVYATGPGSEAMPSFVDNIHLHGMMLAALGVSAGR